MISDQIRHHVPADCEDKTLRIQELMGIVKAIVTKRLPDNFNLTIKVRSRMFKRLELHPVVEETVIEHKNVPIR